MMVDAARSIAVFLFVFLVLITAIAFGVREERAAEGRLARPHDPDPGFLYHSQRIFRVRCPSYGTVIHVQSPPLAP
jgi:hypothetical protein